MTTTGTVHGTPTGQRLSLISGWKQRFFPKPAVTGSAAAGEPLHGQTTTKLNAAGAGMGRHTYTSGAYDPAPGQTTTALGVADTGTRLRLDDPGALQVIRVPVPDRSLDQETRAIHRPAPAADPLGTCRYDGPWLFAGEDPPWFLEVAAALAAAEPAKQPADAETDHSGDVIAWHTTNQPGQEADHA